MLTSDEDRCQSKSRRTGERCKRRRIPPSRFCKFHGGQNVGGRGGPGVPKGTPKPPGSGGPPPKGSTNAMTTGVATPKMPAHMEPLREALLIRYQRAIENPTEMDQMSLERAATFEAKLLYALADPDCPASTTDILQRNLHRELKALKALRVQQESRSSGTSLAEVIAAILAKVAERRGQLQEGRQILAPRVVQHVPAPAQQTADDQDEWPGDDDRECVDAEPWDGDQAEAEAEAEAEAGDDCDDEPDAREPTADESDDQDDSDWWPD